MKKGEYKDVEGRPEYTDMDVIKVFGLILRHGVSHLYHDHEQLAPLGTSVS